MFSCTPLIPVAAFLMFSSPSKAEEPGRFSHILHRGTKSWVSKTMYKNTEISIAVHTLSCANHSDLTLKWMVRGSSCYKEYVDIGNDPRRTDLYMASPYLQLPEGGDGEFKTNRPEGETVQCGESWTLEDLSSKNWTIYPIRPENKKESKREKRSEGSVTTGYAGTRSNSNLVELSTEDNSKQQLLTLVPHDAPYLLIIAIESDANFSCEINVDMKGPHGYLSPTEYPLYILYTVLSVVYFTYTVGWVVVSVKNSKELSSLYYWIGVMILLAMIESVMYCLYFFALNLNGTTMSTTLLELASVTKRSFARMFYLVVSLGIGVVKGKSIKPVILVGAVFFILATIESFVRKNALFSSKAFVVAIPLAITDTVICVCIVVALVKTMKFLKLHNNTGQLSFYRRFSLVLFIAVVCGILLVVFSYYRHGQCLAAWRSLPLDVAVWHVIFFMILTFVIFSRRPKRAKKAHTFRHLMEENDSDSNFEESTT